MMLRSFSAALCSVAVFSAYAGPDSDPGTAASSDEIPALVAEIIADGQARSSMLATSRGGYDNGFFLASEDGSFSLKISGFMQFRYELNFRDDNGIGDDFESGFVAPRTLLILKGNVHG
ncbi:MAG: hypothetical protein KDA21_02000, partial [Phycisphaerales bacterium]|nr:hypothetical protein [Phycisphaerales bacterium]